MTRALISGPNAGVGLLDAIGAVQAQFRHQRAQSLPPPELVAAEARVLLVYLFAGMGDAALLAPAIAALRDSGVSGPIGVVTRALAARTLDLFDLPIETHVVSEALIAAMAGGKGTVATRRESKALRTTLLARGYSHAVDLTHKSTFDARQWLSAPIRFGWLGAGETAADAGLDWGAPDRRAATDRHWSLRQLELLAPFVASPRETPQIPALVAGPTAAAKHSWLPGRRLAVVVGSADENKRWDHLVETVRRVQKRRRSPTAVLALGAPGERALARDVARRVNGRSYTGRDLKRLVALLRSADAVLTNDTGPMHLAHLLGTPTVSVFTLMSPTVWGPLVPGDAFETFGPDATVAEVTAAVVARLNRRRA